MSEILPSWGATVLYLYEVVPPTILQLSPAAENLKRKHGITPLKERFASRADFIERSYNREL
jgi:hypothetical protein